MTAYIRCALFPVYDPDKHTLSLYAGEWQLPLEARLPKTDELGTPHRVIMTNVPCPSEDVAWIKTLAFPLGITPEDQERMRLDRGEK